MKWLPEKYQRYSTFLAFILKYRRSDLFGYMRDSALDMQKEAESTEFKSYSEPAELVKDLKEMGPTYVKLGQLLSTRPDLIPVQYIEALEELQDNVETISYEKIQEIVEKEIGAKISKIFTSFDPVPLASASIGQVHKAVLPSGRIVVVKVQRPGVRQQFIKDLETLTEVTNMAVKYSSEAREYALDEMVDEFKHILLNELDYNLEAQNLLALGRNLKPYRYLVIPQPVREYSTSKVLTMDFIEGKKITNLGHLKMMETDFNPVIDDFVEAYLQQVLNDGLAHADPHPGNVFLTPDDKIALVDMGMVAKFGPDLQENILKLLIALSKYNGASTAEALLRMSKYDEDADIERFEKYVNRVVLNSQNKVARDMQTGQMLILLNKLAADNGIKIAVELNILGKILLNLDQIVAKLTPEYDLQSSLKKNVEKIMRRKMLHELKPENFYGEILELKRLFEKAPERLNKILSHLAKEQLEIKVNAIDETRLTDGFQKVANRITLGLIISAMIVGAALLMRLPTNFTILGYPGFAMLFFLLAAILGLVMVVGILLNDESLRFKKKK